MTEPDPLVFNSGSLVSKSIAISSYYLRSGYSSGSIHSVCASNIGTFIFFDLLILTSLADSSEQFF